MKKYEVTIPFKSGPWYTGLAMAEDKLTAIRQVAAAAKAQGWTGCPSGKAEVLEIKERA